MSIPELAEQIGHSPQMTAMTYMHVIRELKGEPPLSAEEQIEQTRSERRGPQVDPEAVERLSRQGFARQNACKPGE